jgi:hypothetical protein
MPHYGARRLSFWLIDTLRLYELGMSSDYVKPTNKPWRFYVSIAVHRLRAHDTQRREELFFPQGLVWISAHPSTRRLTHVAAWD